MDSITKQNTEVIQIAANIANDYLKQVEKFTLPKYVIDCQICEEQIISNSCYIKDVFPICDRCKQDLKEFVLSKRDK